MARSPVNWNYDLILTAQAQIADVQNDMLRCLHYRQVSAEVRQRMTEHLRNAVNDLDRLTATPANPKGDTV